MILSMEENACSYVSAAPRAALEALQLYISLWMGSVVVGNSRTFREAAAHVHSTPSPHTVTAILLWLGHQKQGYQSPSSFCGILHCLLSLPGSQINLFEFVSSLDLPSQPRDLQDRVCSKDLLVAKSHEALSTGNVFGLKKGECPCAIAGNIKLG